MVFGITSPIVVDGVTKQSSLISPFKSTIITSLEHRYLDDILSLDLDTVVIESMSKSVNDPHFPDNCNTLTLSIMEVTDDGYLVALSHNISLLKWRFQLAYKWLTSWEKTTAHVLNALNSLPPTLLFPSITNKPEVDLWTGLEHEVPVSTDKFNFLCMQVDNSKSRYYELLNLINSFTFPSFTTQTPFTLI